MKQLEVLKPDKDVYIIKITDSFLEGCCLNLAKPVDANKFVKISTSSIMNVDHKDERNAEFIISGLREDSCSYFFQKTKS